MLAGEVVDGTVMRAAALRSFLEEQVARAKADDVLFSVHLKATMMKVSDPIIFGHAVKAFLPRVFEQHGAALQKAGLDADNGLGGILSGLDKLPGRRDRTRSRRPSTPGSPRGRGWRWSTPTAASPTCTCPAT